MEGEELEAYFTNIEIFVDYFDTKIDFEDIENPLKTAFKTSKIAVNPSNPLGETLELKQH